MYILFTSIAVISVIAVRTPCLCSRAETIAYGRAAAYHALAFQVNRYIRECVCALRP